MENFEHEHENEQAEQNDKPEKKRRKIIIVDDIKFQLLSIKERLKSHYEIYPAQSTQDLFELLERVNPEIILLDVNMPDCDGFETIKGLKSNPKYAEIPIIFLTADYNKQSITKGMSLGALDFVKKPFVDADLIKCIETHLTAEKKEEKPIILAIDDNPSILKSINSLLRDKYSIYTLPESAKATTLLEMITPDLFILDCKMPGLSGFELVPIIRKLKEHDETPIIFLTSEGSIDNISVAINLGASDFIIKPVDEKILREKTALHLKNYVMRRRVRSL
jgi:PleD family two-component response regulator